MNKSSTFIFLLEQFIFIFCVLFFEQFWGLGTESCLFLIVVFAFNWLYHYQRSVVLMEYFSHLLIVIVSYTTCLLFIAIILRKIPHIFNVGLLSGITWFLLVCIIRLLVIQKAGRPYNFLIHPDLDTKLRTNHKINLLKKKEVYPSDLQDIQAIVIDRKYHYREDWNNLIIHAAEHDIPIVTLKEYEELVEQRLSLEKLNENWMYAGFSLPLWYKWTKTALDLLLILVFLPAILLLVSVVSLIILVTMGRPIFYTQYRVGKNNRLFKMYKFRSMVVNADRQGETNQNDTRITKFGHFMRKYRIDEVPQFFNILKGDMSLIGPRPEWSETAESFDKQIPLYNLRHIVKPGITGWAQVNQGHTIGADGNFEKLQYDLYYVKHYSFILDFKIFLKTILTLLTGFGAK